MTEYSTVCPRNCYSTCSFKVVTENGRIAAIRPHAANLATPEGPCLKGLAYVERANSADRLLYPLRKVGNGQFERVSWDEAFDLLTNRLRKYRDESGPHSVMFFAASGMSGLLNGVATNFWKLFGGATTTYGNLCWPAGLEATRLTLGANLHNDPWDLVNARLIVLWGKNPAETNVQQMLHIAKAQETGARLMVVDPRRTASSDRAQWLVQIKPGTDAALALGLANELIRQGLTNKKFVETHVLGFDSFAERVKNYQPEKVAAVCGIPAKSIPMLAEIIGTTAPMTLVPGYGMQRFSNGGQTIRALLALSVITGNIGIAGGCWHYANLQSYVFDALKEPENYYPGTEAPCFRRAVSMARLGDDLLNLTNPAVRMIWVERGNPLTQNPDTNKVRQAFRKAEFRVVVDQFMTDTALEADLVLPAKNMFEQADLVGSYWNPYVQLRQQVTEPAGEVKPESEIYHQLASRLGFDAEATALALPSPGKENTENWLAEKLKPFDGLTLEKLKEGPVLPPTHQPIPFANGHFPTPSGKIELWSDEAARRWGVDPLPDYIPLETNHQFPLMLMSPNSKNRIHSQFGNLEVIRQFESEPVLWVNPVDASSRGLKHHDKATLFNDVAEAPVVIGLDAGIRQGGVVLTNGHWHQHGASPNLFTRGRHTDMGYGTAFHDTFVELKKRV